RADGHIEEVGAGDRLRDIRGEADPIAVRREQLLEARLVDRDLAPAQRVDLLRDDVANDDVVAERCEAGPGDETDVAGGEDADPRHDAPRLLTERLEPAGDGDHRLVRELV